MFTWPSFYTCLFSIKQVLQVGIVAQAAILSNIDTENAEHVYTSYISRNNIEVMFDGIKNVLHADRTYMQNEDALEGWMFINHIAIQWYYLIYSMLKQNKMLKRYSVSDFILHLYEIKKVRINDS